MSYLKNYEKSVIEEYYIAKANDLIKDAEKDGFDKACEKNGTSKKEIAPFPLNYGNLSIAASLDTTDAGITGAENNEEFLTTAFSLKMNEISKPIVIGNNIAVLQFTKEETVSAEEEKNVLTEVTSFDEASVQNAILNSPKLENDFSRVYFKYFMN